jgi:hypothetical protein
LPVHSIQRNITLAAGGQAAAGIAAIGQPCSQAAEQNDTLFSE